MDFSKPKVTIDLDEYNYLKELDKPSITLNTNDIAVNVISINYSKILKEIENAIQKHKCYSSLSCSDMLDVVIRTLKNNQ